MYASSRIIERTRRVAALATGAEEKRVARDAYTLTRVRPLGTRAAVVRRDPDVARLTDARLVAAVTEPLSRSFS